MHSSFGCVAFKVPNQFPNGTGFYKIQSKFIGLSEAYKCLMLLISKGTDLTYC